MAGFDRFNTTWANAGIIIPPTTPQYDAGFAFLGPTPPSVELFNAMFQEQDEKDNWLYNQIAEVIGAPPTELPPTQLADAIRDIVTSSQPDLTAYVLKAGDIMTGSLEIRGAGGVGLVSVAPTSLLYGAWNEYPMGFAWGDANDLRVRVGDTDVGTIPLNMTPSNYVLKTGDAMSGDLSLPNLWASATVSGLNVQASNIVYANANNMFFGPGGDGTAIQFSPAYYFTFNSITGTISLVNPAGYVFNMDAAANFSFLGSGTIGYNLTVNNTLSVGGPSGFTGITRHYGHIEIPNAYGQLLFHNPGVNASAIRFNGPASQLEFGPADGVTITAISFAISTVSNWTFAYYGLHGASLAVAPIGSIGGQSMGYPSTSGSTWTMSTNNGASPGMALFTRPGSPGWSDLTINGICYALSYPGASDESLKTAIVPWSVGLAEILAIEPIEYELKEGVAFGPPGVKHYGVSAQQIQSVLPEAVSSFEHIVEEPIWEIDNSIGPDEPIVSKCTKEGVYETILAVDAAVVTFAMINAIKELNARLTAGGL